LDLPVPGSRPLLDPSNERDRQIIIAFFEEFVIAEDSARKWFSYTSDSHFVRDTKAFDDSREYLVKEEEGHVQLCKDVLQSLGVRDIKPNPKSIEFWSSPEKEFEAMFPLSPAQAALLATVSEGLGMIFMTSLESIITNSPAKNALHQLTQDEIGHLSACEIIIKNTLSKDPSTNKELMFALNRYFDYARVPAQAQKSLVESAGLNYYQIATKMVDDNLDRIEGLGMNLGLKWGSARKLASRLGLLSFFVRFYL
jgi:hypothetical protein